MEKNKIFFQNKTYEQILNELKFDKHIKYLEKKLKGKTIAIYGAGIMFDYIADHYDLSGLNITMIADKRYEYSEEKTHKGYRTLPPDALAKEKDIDIIIVSTLYPVAIKIFIEKVIYEKKRAPKVYFMLNKPFPLYFEEIYLSGNF